MSLTPAALDLDALYVAIDRARRTRRLYWREVALEARVPPSLLSRLAQGHSMDAHNLARLLVWLGSTDLAPYLLTVTSQDRSYIHPPVGDNADSGSSPQMAAKVAHDE